MHYWIRCNNCGKVDRFPYSNNKDSHKQATNAGWIYEDNKEFCSKVCLKEYLEHFEQTSNPLNLPAAWRYQQSLKSSKS